MQFPEYKAKGPVDAFIQDQTTAPVLIPFHRIDNGTTLTAAMVIGERTMTVAANTGAAADKMALVYNVDQGLFSWFKVVSVAGNVITLDTLIDKAFPSGSYVDFATYNMAVDGSTTPQVFGLRGSTLNPAVGVRVDVTRIIVAAKTTNPVDLDKFADQARLTNGLMMRQRLLDGIRNIFNFKSNGELTFLCYDWTPYVATNPNQGQHGLAARLTFGSQGKIGVVLRVGPQEDLEIIVQDDLSAITKYGVIAEGHVVSE